MSSLLMGVGAWVYSAHTFYAFCVSAIVGGVLAVLMVLAAGAWQKALLAVLENCSRNYDDSRSRQALRNCGGAQTLNEVTSIWNSDCDRNHSLFCLDGNAHMNTKDPKACESSASQVGQTASTFPFQSFNLHKMSGSYRKQRGAAAVEFAVVAPVFILLIFGMIEYGRMVMVQQMLTNASREGARRAVLEGATETEVRDVVKTYLSPAHVPVVDSDITFGIGTSATAAALNTANYGDPIHVSVGINFGQVSWLPSPMYLSSGTRMTATSVMRKESVN